MLTKEFFVPYNLYNRNYFYFVLKLTNVFYLYSKNGILIKKDVLYHEKIQTYINFDVYIVADFLRFNRKEIYRIFNSN